MGADLRQGQLPKVSPSPRRLEHLRTNLYVKHALLTVDLKTTVVLYHCSESPVDLTSWRTKNHVNKQHKLTHWQSMTYVVRVTHIYIYIYAQYVISQKQSHWQKSKRT